MKPEITKILTSTPRALTGWVLARQCLETPVLFVAENVRTLNEAEHMVRFFAPECRVFVFPAWDCLPYDYVSPRAALSAQRLRVLARLNDGDFPNIVMTTAEAFLQRLPPKESVANTRRMIAVGDTLERVRFLDFLIKSGYQREETVHSPGRFAVRGSLMDIFVSGHDHPVRMDFLGERIDSMDWFEPASQRRLEPVSSVELLPHRELQLTPANRACFRTKWRILFGAESNTHPFYQQIAKGEFPEGAEHYLPLFYKQACRHISEWLPQYQLIFEHGTRQELALRYEIIINHYAARGPKEYALPPESLYDSPESLARLLEGRVLAELTSAKDSPFSAQIAKIDNGGRSAPEFASARQAGQLWASVAKCIQARLAHKPIVLAASGSVALRRLRSVWATHELPELHRIRHLSELPARRIGLAELPILSGFETDSLLLLTDSDLLGAHRLAPARRKPPQSLRLDIADIEPGDFIVHIDHGIGRYEGIETLKLRGGVHECLLLSYAGEVSLYVPVENMESVSRFGGPDCGAALDRLGAGGWQKRRARTKARIFEMAAALIETAAKRQKARAERFAPPESGWEEFCARFPFVETEDQNRAMEDILADMGSGRPMNRLICGDTGYGKTEIALRAAFIAVHEGYQVILLAPTSLLVRQHLEIFRARFEGFPVTIAGLSRFDSSVSAKKLRAGLADGRIDIVIGAHGLLSPRIVFSRPGLVIIDEEQHFGVKQKEWLHALAETIHILTLTATPIPRSLQQALAGVRAMSLITTPPLDRLAVRNFVMTEQAAVIRDALRREKLRGGRVFYVCPRISDLEAAEEKIRRLAPDMKTALAHGKMSSQSVEPIMKDFVAGKLDVLVSTQIVESGLDIPGANTMIIEGAHRFGLAQLYQLRGRVGRGRARGYCYFLLPSGRALSVRARKRLAVMETMDALGAGFSLASHDMDIRGAGNLLGVEQSGHIREIGVELYQKMLTHAVRTLSQEKDGMAAPSIEELPKLHLGVPVQIPESYIPDSGLRLGLYRRISAIEEEKTLHALRSECADRFGTPPLELENLLFLIGLRNLCLKAGIARAEAHQASLVLYFRKNRFANPEGLLDWVGRHTDRLQLRSDHALVCHGQFAAPQQRLVMMKRLVTKISQLALSAPHPEEEALGVRAVSAGVLRESPMRAQKAVRR